MKGKRKKWQTEEAVGRQYQGMDFASPTRAAENRTRWEGIDANSSVVPRRPSKVMGKNRIELHQVLCFGVLNCGKQMKEVIC